MGEDWNRFEEVWKETCITVLGMTKKEGDKEWMSTDTWKLIEEGEEDGDGEAEHEPVQCKDYNEKRNRTQRIKHYTEKRSEEEEEEDKRHFHDTLVSGAEQTAGCW
ncbi:unnamed protein product [Heterobilharzia americana]|nr:unnamed protein product [Heterobilharzia americana]